MNKLMRQALPSGEQPIAMCRVEVRSHGGDVIRCGRAPQRSQYDIMVVTMIVDREQLAVHRERRALG